MGIIKIPKAFKWVLIKAMKKMAVNSYIEGKKHYISGEYDEKEFKKLIGEQINKQFNT